MVDIYTDTVKDTDAFHIAYIARKVIEQKGERVYTYSRDKIKWHKEQGHKVIALSGSPIELVREMSEKYEMDDYRARSIRFQKAGLQRRDYTDVDSESKRKAVLEMAEKHNIDLSVSYAYGDTAGDFSMLKLVGNPFAINPTRELLSRIKEDDQLKGRITVVVERKDVTYRLNVNTLDLI